MTWLGEEGLLPRLRWLARGLRGAPRGGEHTPWIVAHRGAAKHAAENTRAAFARAIALGADGIEADVCATSDRVFVLWHDADPDDPVARIRQAGGEGLLYAPVVPEKGAPERRKVAEQTFAEFRRHHSYRLAGTPPKGAPSPPQRADVETLDDLFAWMASETRLRRVYLDVKLPAEQAGKVSALVEELARHAGEGSLPRHLAVRTVSPQKEVFLALREGLRGMSGSDVAAIADFELPEARQCAREIAARRVGLGLGRRLWPGYRAESADLVAARDSGEIDEVFLWTINGRARLEQAVRLSPDALLTDEPGILREVAESAL
jgi:glycerophosphoryl diester phosphodiesterase